MRGMSPETFRVVSQPSSRAGLQILQLKGPFTSGASAIFVSAVAAADAPRLILDLTDVPMVDSMAVGALVRAFVSCHKTGRKLALVGLNHRVHNVLQLTGIAPLFDTYESISAAEAGLG
jgi:anti-sigma B factor antagonist